MPDLSQCMHHLTHISQRSKSYSSVFGFRHPSIPSWYPKAFYPLLQPPTNPTSSSAPLHSHLFSSSSVSRFSSYDALYSSVNSLPVNWTISWSCAILICTTFLNGISRQFISTCGPGLFASLLDECELCLAVSYWIISGSVLAQQIWPPMIDLF